MDAGDQAVGRFGRREQRRIRQGMERAQGIRRPAGKAGKAANAVGAIHAGTTALERVHVRGLTMGFRAFLLLTVAGLSPAVALDLSKTVVVFPAERSARERKAVTMLVGEVEKRTQIRWPAQTSWPASNQVVIAVGMRSSLTA